MGAGLGFGGVTASLLVLGLEARRSKVRTGSDAMLGWLAVAQTPLAPEGHILVRGELWRARLTSKDSAVAAGDHVKVLRADGMLLEVTAVPVAANP
jgi:membrane-bound serine protease (ClpP class)